MNTKEGGEGAGKVERAKTFLAALEPYFTASDLLAQDKAEGVSELLHQTVTGLGALPQDAELGPRIKHVTELVHKTMGQNLDGLRESFRAMSAELIALGKTIGVPADGPTVRVFHCPMGEKPDWLQAKVETFNPYMGTRMPGCGGPTETLPKVAGAVPPRLTTGGKLVAVPRSAVIRTGKRDVVFVANPQMEGVYDLRAVTIGPAGAADGGEYYPVLSGLEPGQRVVTTGAFLLDAENRLNPTGEAQ